MHCGGRRAASIAETRAPLRTCDDRCLGMHLVEIGEKAPTLFVKLTLLVACFRRAASNTCMLPSPTCDDHVSLIVPRHRHDI